MAEYNYQVETVDGEVMTFDEASFMKKQLNDEVVIFQPVGLTEEEITAVDMESMADILRKLHDSNIIKENIILLPPNVNIFRAKLAKPNDDNIDDDSDN